MNGGTRTIARDPGRVLQALSVMMAVSLAVPLTWQELYGVPGLAASAVVCVGAGRVLLTRVAGADDSGRFHGTVLAAAGWLLVAGVGTTGVRDWSAAAQRTTSSAIRSGARVAPGLLRRGGAYG